MVSQPDNLEIISQVLTFNDVDDAEAGIGLIEKIEENIKVCAGDGAYDKSKFQGCLLVETKQLIPPQENAVYSDNEPVMYQRDEAIKFITDNDRTVWKQSVEYHIRSKSDRRCGRGQYVPIQNNFWRTNKNKKASKSTK